MCNGSSGSGGSSGSSGGGSVSGSSIAKQAGVSNETYNSGKTVRAMREVRASLKDGSISRSELTKIQSKAGDKVKELQTIRNNIYKETKGNPYGTPKYQQYKDAKAEIKMLNAIRSL